MKNKSFKKFFPVLILQGILCLSACVRTSSDLICPTLPALPPFPIAGPKVAAELEKAGDLPATWEWLGRVYQLKVVSDSMLK